MTRLIAFVIWLVSAVASSFALEGDVTLTLNASKQSDNRVKLIGSTNLPPGTKLKLSVKEKIERGFWGQADCAVLKDGTFESVAFGPNGGLKDGLFVAEAFMPIARFQSEDVKLVIGAKGERLSGPLVRKLEVGNTVTQQTEFSIGDNPGVTQADRIREIEASSASIKLRTCVLLEELLQFKDEPRFKEFGFGTGGPYNKWLKSVEALRDSTPKGQDPIPLLIRIAPGDLLTLGMEYLQHRETNFTRRMLPELKKTIDYDGYLDAKRKPYTAQKSEMRVWRDSTGKFDVDAKLVEQTESHVVLQKKDGATVNVPIKKLCPDDIEYIRGHASK